MPFRLDRKTVFAFDAAGAFASTLMLGVVLPFFQSFMGLSLEVLYLLGGLAGVFFLYSTCSFLFANEENPNWLKGIIFANSSYCLLTASLLALHWQEVLWPGVVYFVSEILIIFGVVWIELRVLKRGSF